MRTALMILERRPAGRYESRRGLRPAVIFVGFALMVAGTVFSFGLRELGKWGWPGRREAPLFSFENVP